MAFTAKILSWRFCHLNIVGCLLKRRPTKGGHGHPRTPPPLATPLRVALVLANARPTGRAIPLETGVKPTDRVRSPCAAKVGAAVKNGLLWDWDIFVVDRLTNSRPSGNFRITETVIQNTIKPPRSSWPFSSLCPDLSSFLPLTSIISLFRSPTAHRQWGKKDDLSQSTFLMIFECRLLLSPLELFDYPIRKSAVIRNWPANRPGQAWQKS